METTQNTTTTTSTHRPSSDGTLWLLVLLFQLSLSAFKVLPGIVYWLVTFTSMTLPAWLFSLFSTSLTFTMNATTL